MLQWIFLPFTVVGTFFMYPVSLCLRFWHWLLAEVLHLDPSTAWVASIVLLVVTVRLLLFPLAYRQQLNTRKMVLLRPKTQELTEYYRFHIDPDAPQRLKWHLRTLRRENGVRLSTGCVTPLIQLPVILGLLQLVRHLGFMVGDTVRPNDVAYIPREEVGNFLHAGFLGAPLPAYVGMPGPTLAGLNTTREDVIGVLVPLIVVATVLTAANMAWPVLRMWWTLDHRSRFARRMFVLLVVMSAVGSVFPPLFGWFGPASTAIMLYWVCNNLWTVLQSVFLWFRVDRRLPLTDEFREHREKTRDELLLMKRGGPEAEEKKALELKRLRAVAKYRAMLRLMRPDRQDEIPPPSAATRGSDRPKDSLFFT